MVHQTRSGTKGKKEIMKIRTKILVLLTMAFIPAISACKKDAALEQNHTGGEQNTDDSTENSTEDIVANGEKVTVEIVQYKSEIHNELQAAIDKYTQLYPNVSISLESVGGTESADEVYKRKIHNGGMPDIFNCAGPDACAMYGDYLEDLSDEPWVEHANSGMLDLDTIDGKVYGLPVTTEGMGLIVNKAMFEDAGIDIYQMDNFDRIEKGFSDLQKAIDNGSLKETYPNLTDVVAVQGRSDWVLGDHAMNICLSPEFGGDVFACAKAKKVDFKYRDAFQSYMELQLKYSGAKDDYSKALDVDYDTAVKMLAKGQVACIQQGNWIYKQVEKTDKETADNLAYIPAPIKGYAEDCIFSMVSSYWCVNKQSDEHVKDAAKHFLNWLYQSEEGKDIVVFKLGFTPVFDNYGDLRPSDPLTKNMMEFFENGKGISTVFQGCPGGEKYSQKFFARNEKCVLTGKLDWNTFFDKAAKEWEKRAENR